MLRTLTLRKRERTVKIVVAQSVSHYQMQHNKQRIGTRLKLESKRLAAKPTRLSNITITSSSTKQQRSLLS